MNNKHQRKDNLICHSAAGGESPVFVEFLAPTHNYKTYFIKV
ncbi:hypothetical protein SULYE_0710 [Sulfurihydrogenibium yellowstonense SS-5]|uniref:Uncharacterized protein n=1 Tax=Sulfurihydrogenibium yellowstonense SS-5 TaxID=432331 RepID=C4FJG3_9AQUI|nr:hypothetical protein SULYE_0710 [Sulfurihydrogenibium yellowstonense SS-5]